MLGWRPVETYAGAEGGNWSGQRAYPGHKSKLSSPGVKVLLVCHSPRSRAERAVLAKTEQQVGEGGAKGAKPRSAPGAVNASLRP